MTDSDRRCVPPCERILSDFDKHEFCFECLGADHAAQGLEGECELCDVFEFRVLRARLAFFKRDRATSSSSWGSRFELAEAREADPSASPVHSPNRDVLASASGACFGTSPEPAEDEASLVSAGLDSTASERSSRDTKAIEDLIGAVTKAVDRLHLDWPQEQEAPKDEHAFQQFIECSFSNEGQVDRLWKYGYDGKDMMHIDLVNQAVVATSEPGERLAEERQGKEYIKRKEDKLKMVCSAVKTVFLLSNNSLSKAVKPSVFLSSGGKKEEEYLKCAAHGFYPNVIRVRWTQTGRPIYYGV
ncbi:hypothetical protein E1301_Tti019223 [Triplophysa tibetana]|uniref:Ig-like domain-containing protein n=1 Tax=Triplophysa tibetana TaxID=1572043 RepID=A0A5A9P8P8_9TELE|nr:hypothetical protein E1301_Tti019223 [Triplophysa tibetana]